MGAVQPSGGQHQCSDIDLIKIALARGAPPGVKGRLHLFHGKNPYIIIQQTVQPRPESGAGDLRGRSETGRHAKGMNAGIGTAGAMENDFLPGHDGDFSLKGALDRRLIRLTLPAGIIRAVKGDCQFDITPGHGKSGMCRKPRSSGKEQSRFIF